MIKRSQFEDAQPDTFTNGQIATVLMKRIENDLTITFLPPFLCF